MDTEFAPWDWSTVRQLDDYNFADMDLNDILPTFNDGEMPPKIIPETFISVTDNPLAINEISPLTLDDAPSVNESTLDNNLMFLLAPATTTTTLLPGLGSVPVTNYVEKMQTPRNVSPLIVAQPSSSSIMLSSSPNGPSKADQTVPRSPLTSTAESLVPSTVLPMYVDCEMFDKPDDEHGGQHVGSVSTVSSQNTAVKRGRPLMKQVANDAPISDKKARRQEQNRRAATKCRQKRRQEFDEMKKKHEEAINENKRIKQELEDVKRKWAACSRMLQNHVQSCQLVIPPALALLAPSSRQ